MVLVGENRTQVERLGSCFHFHSSGNSSPMPKLHVITRTLEFDYGHRVLNHEGKCKYLHGHRGKAEITIGSDYLDDCGRVLDFGKVKEIVGGWIDDNWDHNMILHPEDSLLRASVVSTTNLSGRDPYGIWEGKFPFIMPKSCPNPTAENLVFVLAEKCVELLSPYDLNVCSVRLYETPNAYATYNYL